METSFTKGKLVSWLQSFSCICWFLLAISSRPLYANEGHFGGARSAPVTRNCQSYLEFVTKGMPAAPAQCINSYPTYASSMLTDTALSCHFPLKMDSIRISHSALFLVMNPIKMPLHPLLILGLIFRVRQTLMLVSHVVRNWKANLCNFNNSPNDFDLKMFFKISMIESGP